ncbi:ExbD/TolR family protein [Aestuariibius insulae]|uniref:ExbD/TolR family protein n=1 Tax=Aestuariibius insulae TaxID=2058287 RepID=UPI00345E62A9
MRPRRRKSRLEPTIALINIVFLMLIFFMAAGTLAPPLDRDLQLVSTAELDGAPPPDALVIHPDGRMSYRGEDQVSVAGFMDALTEEERTVLRVVPDRALPAQDLVEITGNLHREGAGRVVAVTERGLP